MLPASVSLVSTNVNSSADVHAPLRAGNGKLTLRVMLGGRIGSGGEKPGARSAETKRAPRAASRVAPGLEKGMGSPPLPESATEGTPSFAASQAAPLNEMHDES